MIDTINDTGKIARSLLVWAADHWMDRGLPWRRSEEPLVRQVVVEALLAQTRAEAAAERYPTIFAGVTDAATFGARYEAVIAAAAGLGLPRLKRMAIESIWDWYGWHDGPANVRALWGKQGIGEYTWGMIACLVGEAAAPVDCNVQRVAARVAPDVTPAAWIGEVVQAAQGVEVPAVAGFANGYVAVSAVLDLGATRCRIGVAPRCAACPLAHACAFARDGSRQMELDVLNAPGLR